MKRLSATALIVALLSGCAPGGSRQAELNQSTGRLLPVSALAIDTRGPVYTMTVESIRQDSLDGNAAPAYFSVEAETFDELFAHADQMLASRLYLMHARTVLISDAVARHALDALADSLLARPDARLTLRIAVAREHTPDDILRAVAISEGIPGVALADLLDRRASDGTVADCPLFRMLDRQVSGVTFSLPVLRLSPDGYAAPGGSVEIANGTLTYTTGGVQHA